jgi:hypothetical protein
MSKGAERQKTAGKTCHDDAADDLPANGLSAKQDRAIQALLQEPTIGRAAAAAGVGERTLHRWLTEPVFRSAVLAARRQAFSHAIGLTARYVPVAVATLVKVMQDGTTPPAAKVTAAAVLMKFGRESIELDDLAERIEVLERGMQVLPALPPLTEDEI